MGVRYPGQANIDPSNPEAVGVCDRCGRLFNLSALRWQYQWSGATLINLNLRVCSQCLDVPSEQLRSIRLPPDPVPVSDPRLENFAADFANDITLGPIIGHKMFEVSASMSANLNVFIDHQITANFEASASMSVETSTDNDIVADFNVIVDFDVTTTALIFTILDVAGPGSFTATGNLFNVQGIGAGGWALPINLFSGGAGGAYGISNQVDAVPGDTIYYNVGVGEIPFGGSPWVAVDTKDAELGGGGAGGYLDFFSMDPTSGQQDGGDGGSDTAYDADHGCGGGGGGGGSIDGGAGATKGRGGAGGLYGGGGGGTGGDESAGSANPADAQGAQGILKLVFDNGGGTFILTTPGPGSMAVPLGSTSFSAEGNARGGDGDQNGTTDDGGGGGGGSAYAKTNSIAVSGGQTIFYNVGTTGAVDSWVNKATNAAPASTTNGVLIKAGSNASAGTGGQGGQAAACIGDTAFNGGNGGNGVTTTSNASGGGGGGAAGPSGVGRNGGTGVSGAFNNGGGGGGGANGGSSTAGSNPVNGRARGANGGQGTSGTGRGLGTYAGGECTWLRARVNSRPFLPIDGILIQGGESDCDRSSGQGAPAGGSAALCIADSATNGGNGSLGGAVNGGGGGSAGPVGIGKNGGAANVGGGGGPGGGGANGGSSTAGSANSGGDGGNGGNGTGGTGGGVGATSAVDGGAGSDGGGGGGGFNDDGVTSTGTNGGDGGSDTSIDSGHGAGGGGGASGTDGALNGGTGGDGGLYGGGAGTGDNPGPGPSWPKGGSGLIAFIKEDVT